DTRNRSPLKGSRLHGVQRQWWRQVSFRKTMARSLDGPLGAKEKDGRKRPNHVRGSGRWAVVGGRWSVVSGQCGRWPVGVGTLAGCVVSHPHAGTPKLHGPNSAAACRTDVRSQFRVQPFRLLTKKEAS